MINPVQDITPDCRPMEGTAYPEHSAPGASLDSGLRAGMSSLEPLQQSVLNTSLVAQTQVEIRTSDWKPVINPVQDITPDGRPMEETTYPEHPALGVSLDSGLREGITRSVTRPDGGSIREFTKWNAMAHPVPDINLDGRSMEGNTYLEPSALGVSLDSGLMEGLLCPEPLEQSVLGALSVIRPDETDRPERPALASHMHHKQSCFQSSARPMLDPSTESVGVLSVPRTSPVLNAADTNQAQPEPGPSFTGDLAGGLFPTIPLTLCLATASRHGGELDAVGGSSEVPDLSREGPFDIHQDHPRSVASPQLLQDNFG